MIARHDDKNHKAHKDDKEITRKGRHADDALDAMEREEREKEVSERELGDVPVINPLGVLTGASVLTVTRANPTPPTNIPCVAAGTPPHALMVPATNLRDSTWVPPAVFTTAMKPTYTVDAALMKTASDTAQTGLTPNTPAGVVALTAIATPTGGSGGTGVAGGNVWNQTAGTPNAAVVLDLATVAEAASSLGTGVNTVVVAPGSRQAPFPVETWTQAISVQGSYNTAANPNHPSYAPHITTLSPNPTPSGASPTTIALTVEGTGFNAGSVVNVNGGAQTTVFVSQSKLTVAAAPRRSTAGNSTINVTTDTIVSPNAVLVFT